ncbi:MAG: hypothetical protein RIQ59_1925 [Bacteroidota bacterium]
MKLNTSSWVLNLFVFFIFLQNPPWPIWEFYFPILVICVLITFGLLFKRIISKKNVDAKFLVLTSCLILFFVFFQYFQKISVSSSITIIVFFLLNYISDDEKRIILNKLTSVLTIIIAVSLPLWLVNQFYYKFPFGYEMNYGDWKGDDGVTILENYYFFIQEKHDFLNRFYSVFDEPGVLSTLASFVLFANKYNFKDKRNFIILLGAFFTYSLTFILLTFIGLILYNFRKPVFFIKLFSFLLVISVLLLPVLKENPTFNTSIISRVLVLNSSIEERTSDNLKYYFSDYLTSTDVILGKGMAFLGSRPDLKGQGYQKFFIENGLIGSILVFLIYFSFNKKGEFLIFAYMALFLFSLIQRPFLFTPWQIIVYSIGAANLTKFKSRNDFS